LAARRQLQRRIHNWGLIANRDNAYDGKAAIEAPGTDKWGFATGGQDDN
jgi:hypothetical protein